MIRAAKKCVGLCEVMKKKQIATFLAMTYATKIAEANCI
jgi:hypothetical protein